MPKDNFVGNKLCFNGKGLCNACEEFRLCGRLKQWDRNAEFDGCCHASVLHLKPVILCSTLPRYSPCGEDSGKVNFLRFRRIRLSPYLRYLNSYDFVACMNYLSSYSFVESDSSSRSFVASD